MAAKQPKITRPKITQRGPALTEADVAAVEQRRGISFPPDYRAFLLEINGGVVRPGKWVKQLFSLGNVPPEASFEVAFDNLKVAAQRIPRRMTAVGDDDGGNLFCISTGGDDRGVVYYWSHEDESAAAAERGGPSDAAVKEFAPSFDALLAKEAKVKRAKIPPWLEMIEEGDVAGFTRWLDAGGRLSEYFDDAGSFVTPLTAAAREGRADFVMSILDHGGRVDDAFRCAVRNPALARALLSRGVSRGVLSEQLAGGAVLRDLDLMRAVLDAGADPNAAERTARGHWTALQRAALEGPADAVRMLLERGATPGVWREVDNEMALHLAIRRLDFESVKLLLDAGEDLYAAPPPPAPENAVPGFFLRGGPAIEPLRKTGNAAFVRRVEEHARARGQRPRD